MMTSPVMEIICQVMKVVVTAVMMMTMTTMKRMNQTQGVGMTERTNLGLMMF